MPGKGTPKRNLRIPDDEWEAAAECAAADGTNVSDVIRDLLREYVRKHRERTPQ